MRDLTKRLFVAGVALGILAFVTSCVAPASGNAENELVAKLASPNEGEVREAMARLEAECPTSTTWHPAVRKMLADPREEVRLKAARVLGVVHAEVTAEDLKNITMLFKAVRPNVVMGALKALRGLKAESTLPEILPLLQNVNDGIVRDALRTIAVLGNPSLLPQIEPLLNHSSSNVKKDAKDCVAELKAKH